MTIESFAQVLDDPRIDDIVILDDCSTDGSYEKLVKHFSGVEKVRVIRQVKNRGMSLNKRDAIAYAKNDWAIIFDSDNILGKDYLDAFLQIIKTEIPLYANFIYCPEFAKPKFDYRGYAGNVFDAKYASTFIAEDKFNMLLNTCNYVVNKSFYLASYETNAAHLASDTIWHNYNHLKFGGRFYVVPNMQYFHRVHPGSGFLKDIGYNMKQAEKIRKMIMAL
jgi:glycosyltransferase involved in cell wall biosynthesis